MPNVEQRPYRPVHYPIPTRPAPLLQKQSAQPAQQTVQPFKWDWRWIAGGIVLLLICFWAYGGRKAPTPIPVKTSSIAPVSSYSSEPAQSQSSNTVKAESKGVAIVGNENVVNTGDVHHHHHYSEKEVVKTIVVYHQQSTPIKTKAPVATKKTIVVKERTHCDDQYDAHVQRTKEINAMFK